MTRESVQDKARRYLTEGRVRIRLCDLAAIEADVRGKSVYHVRRNGRRWSCDCPAWQRACSHVQAVRLVT